MIDPVRVRSRLLAAFAAGALTIAGLAPCAAAQSDTGLFLNVIPPGQLGHLSLDQALDFLSNGTLPANFEDQTPLYDDLVYADPGLTDGDLPMYFKEAGFEQPDAPLETEPFPGLDIEIRRDEFGIPHIKARTRLQVWRGLGYAMAKDRMFGMDLIRRAGRGRLTDFVGYDDFNLDQDEGLYQFSGYDDADLFEQVDRLIGNSPGGRRVFREILAFIEGVNTVVTWMNARPGERAPAEYIGLGLLPIQPFTPLDLVAIATQLEFLFGAGGGGEYRNANLLQKLVAEYGETTGTALFRDLRHANDPEAPTSTERSFPYLVPQPIDPAAVAIPDLNSVVREPIVRVVGPLPASQTSVVDSRFLARSNDQGNPSMSNFLAITGERAVGGHPIAVMGPQTGYFVPQLLYEAAIEGGGLKARGVTVLGTPFVVLGRGENFAWSATAGGSDNSDVFVEKLCVPGGGTPSMDATDYLHDGQCIPMFERLDTWCAGDDSFCNGTPNMEALVQRTVHGIVFARATVDGEPVALARARASFLREAENTLGFRRINRYGSSWRQFRRGVRALPGSFNWLYVNQDDVYYFHSGIFPVRSAGVDFEMPVWGTGQWEWRGTVGLGDHPSDLNPAKGFVTSWNNKPARDWRSADANYSFSSIHRASMLDDKLIARLGQGTPVGVAEMVEIMEDAGLTDLRGSRVLPLALDLIGSEPTLDPVLAILADWVAAGAQRRDRDHDGDYDHSAAVALMDAWHRPMIDATLGPQLADFYRDIPLGMHDAPGPIGSAFQSGYYGMLEKTMRMAAGLPVVEPYQVLRCADGTADGCRAALVSSLTAAVANLTTTHASADPADWDVDEEAERIQFSPFGLAEVQSMHWVNRPTFQQVVQVEQRRAGRR